MASSQPSDGGYWTPAIQSYVYGRLRNEAGASDAGARGLLSRWMNVEAPDGPTSVNPTSGAQGIGQWLGARLPGIVGNTGLDDQLSYAISELNGSESKAGNALRAATTEAQGATGASMYERAAGYNAGTGRDNFTSMTQNKMGTLGVTQYDSAGNPVQPAQAAPPSAAAPATSPQAAPPTQSGADDDALLSKYLGTTPSSPAPAAGTTTQPANSAANSDDDLISKYLSPDPSAPKPGSSAYAQMVINEVANGQPTPQPATPPPESPAATPQDDVPGWARAFSESAVNAVPVIGPGLHNLRNALFGPEGGAQADQVGQAAQDQNPLASTAGSVFGTVAPFVALGGTELGAQALGTAADYGAGPVGNALLRTAAGGTSGAAISGADTLARGGTVQQATNNALLGGAIGAAAPTVLGLAGKALGGAKNAFFGPSAPKMLSNAMVADQNDPTIVNQLLQQNGPGSTVADLGPNTQGLAAGLASLPGQAKSTVVGNLQARAGQTGARLAQDVAGTIGQGQPIGALTDSVVAAQKAAADPLYAAVRSQPVQMTPDLNFIQNTPTGSAAFTAAAKTMQDQGRGGTGITVDFLDKVKQELDDTASSNYSNGRKNAGNNARDMARSLTASVDAQVPAYAQARAAFAGPAKVKDAIEAGQSVFSSNTSPEDVQSMLTTMSPSEQDGLLAGAQSAVQKAIGNARTDAAGVKSLFDSNNGKEKLAILVGPDQAQQISDALARERGFSATSGKAYQNSVTSSNLAQQKVISPQLAGLPQQAPPQTSIGLLIAGLEKARSAVTGAYRNAQNNRLANMLTSGPLSPRDAAAVAGANTPRNALLAPAALSSAAQQNNAQVPGLGAFQQPKMVFRDGRWIPQIRVNGANPLTQGATQ